MPDTSTALLTLGKVADRLAIHNLLGGYAQFASEGNLDEWSDLFADDAIFEIIIPSNAVDSPLAAGTHSFDKTRLIEMEQGLFKIYRARFLDLTLGERRLYLINNVWIVSQSDHDAVVQATLTLVRTAMSGPSPHIDFTGTYYGTFQKRDTGWLIYRWCLRLDRPPEAI